MNDRVAAVVGVGPGLGAAVARRFAREGYSVGLMARNEDGLSEIQRKIEDRGGKAAAFAVDAADAESVVQAFRRVREVLGHPEVLVYNAGAFQMGGIMEVTPEQFDLCLKVNCAGAFYAAQQILPAMVDGGGGTVIFTGATASLRGSAKFAALATGKFGLRALAQSMAREFGPQGIHVAHVIVDGQINTPRVREMSPGRDDSTLLYPAAIAETYWQLHSQDRTAWTLELDLRPAGESF
ncbi:SDR family oxidoreductase [soil metagenome]